MVKVGGVATQPQGGAARSDTSSTGASSILRPAYTFNAGILASLHEQGLLTKAAIGSLPEDAIRKALELGAKAAAVTVSRAGANPPWRHEIV